MISRTLLLALLYFYLPLLLLALAQQMSRGVWQVSSLLLPQQVLRSICALRCCASPAQQLALLLQAAPSSFLQAPAPSAANEAAGACCLSAAPHFGVRLLLQEPCPLLVQEFLSLAPAAACAACITGEVLPCCWLPALSQPPAHMYLLCARRMPLTEGCRSAAAFAGGALLKRVTQRFACCTCWVCRAGGWSQGFDEPFVQQCCCVQQPQALFPLAFLV